MSWGRPVFTGRATFGLAGTGTKGLLKGNQKDINVVVFFFRRRTPTNPSQLVAGDRVKVNCKKGFPFYCARLRGGASGSIRSSTVR